MPSLIRVCLFLLLSVSAPLYASDWTSVPGAATDIGVGADGTVWAIGANQMSGGYGIWRWNGASWTGVPGGAVRISVDPQGRAWVVDNGGAIYYYDGTRFRGMRSGRAKDIAIGAEGSLWVIGPNKVSRGYDIYRWSGSNWTRVPGGAVRISVDPQGNAWVVDSYGAIHRYDGHRFVKVPGKAKDIGVGADGSVWAAALNGDVYKWTGSAWQKQNAKAAAIAVGDQGQAWVVDASNHIKRSAPADVVVQGTLPNPIIHRTDDTSTTGGAGGKDTDVTGSKLVIDSGGSIEIPQDSGQDAGGDKPSLLPEGIGGKDGTTVGSGKHVPTGTLGEVTVLAPTTDYFGSGWARSTGAAQGEKSFKEPGLTPFLLVGALPILNKIYADPATLVSTLRLSPKVSVDAAVRELNAMAAELAEGKSFSGSELRFVRGEFLRAAQDPVGNEAIKGLMGVALVSAARKRPYKRSKAEKSLVSHFERYMQRRKLFIAERAQYLYDAWIQREMMKQKSQVVQLVNIPQVPPDVITQANSAAELGVKAQAVATGMGVALAGAAATYAAGGAIAAVAPFAADAGAGLFVVGGVASSSAASAAAALAGPVGIAAAGIVVVAVSVDQVVKAEEYRKRVASDVSNARKPIDLYKLAQTDDGLKSIRFYWALATGVDEPDTFRGAPAAAFRLPSNVGRFDLERIPSSARGLGFNSLPAGMRDVKLVGDFGAEYGPIEAAWRSYAMAYNNCFAAQNILYYQATGQFTCPPQQPVWTSVFKRGKFPANAVQPRQVKLPPEMWAVEKWRRLNNEREGICRFIAPGGATVGTYKDGRCQVSDAGRRRTEGNNFTVLRADPEKVKWLTPKLRGMPGWVPTSTFNTVKAGIRSDGAKVAVCRVGRVPGWLWKDQCHVVMDSSVTAMPIFDVLVKTSH